MALVDGAYKVFESSARKSDWTKIYMVFIYDAYTLAKRTPP